MGRYIKHTVLTDTLALTEYTDGLYLHDSTRGMNISMYCKTPEEAYVKGITYYQRRLKIVETELSTLRAKVDRFLAEMRDEDDEDYDEV